MQVKVRKDLSEIVDYNLGNFPVYCKRALVSSFPNYSAICHWHLDFEFNYVLKGKMNFYVDGQEYIVREGEGIFVNSNRLHYGYSKDKTECDMFCILFPPTLLNGCNYLSEKYVYPFFSDSNNKSLLLQRDGGWQEEIANIMLSFLHLFEAKQNGFELEVLLGCWKIFYLLHKNAASIPQTKEINRKDIECLEKMLYYIQQHYAEKCSLEEIALAGTVCRSKCFQLFKENLHTTPVNFLTDYRLRKSIELLSTEKNITEIAYACGFCSTSYYTKIFGKFFNCTPTEYKKNKIF